VATLVDKVPHGKRKTATFLGGLRNDRIEAPCLFDGPINGEPGRGPGERRSLALGPELARCCAAAGSNVASRPLWRDLADLSPIVEAESEGRTSLKASTRSNGRVEQLQGRLRGVERRQFKRAAADRAMEAARRPHHDARASLARA
jgi:hypothetical protein